MDTSYDQRSEAADVANKKPPLQSPTLSLKLGSIKVKRPLARLVNKI
jgi:hypothetical protein